MVSVTLQMLHNAAPWKFFPPRAFQVLVTKLPPAPGVEHGHGGSRAPSPAPQRTTWLVSSLTDCALPEALLAETRARKSTGIALTSSPRGWLVSCGGHNQIPQAEWRETAAVYCLTVLEVKVSAGSCFLWSF